MFTCTYQSLVLERVVNAAHQEPEGPQVLEPKLQNEVCQQDQRPHRQELEVHERRADGETGT